MLCIDRQIVAYWTTREASFFFLFLPFFFLTPRHWVLWDGHEEREVRMQSNLENFSLRINGSVEPRMKTRNRLLLITERPSGLSFVSLEE